MSIVERCRALAIKVAEKGVPRGARDEFVLVRLIGTHAESEKRLVSNEEVAMIIGTRQVC